MTPGVHRWLLPLNRRVTSNWLVFNWFIDRVVRQSSPVCYWFLSISHVLIFSSKYFQPCLLLCRVLGYLTPRVVSLNSQLIFDFKYLKMNFFRELNGATRNNVDNARLFKCCISSDQISLRLLYDFAVEKEPFRINSEHSKPRLLRRKKRQWVIVRLPSNVSARVRKCSVDRCLYIINEIDQVTRDKARNLSFINVRGCMGCISIETSGAGNLKLLINRRCHHLSASLWFLWVLNTERKRCSRWTNCCGSGCGSRGGRSGRSARQNVIRY